ncbi:CidA/LrgA family holin-like protein [Marinicrinis lubricantis]|uniref:CidA/LrgA family holin-like protein n=1 Tax=Marinicrinis lubricantis TaxID=2086470 RepID=A0ABW1IV51_9BACL
MVAAYKSTVQIGLLIAIASISNLLAEWLHLPIPGSIIGLIVTFILLKMHVLKLEWLEMGASFLLAELLLFFVPSAVGIISYKQLLLHDGLRVLLIVGIGTAVVMMSSGLLAQKFADVKEREGK